MDVQQIHHIPSTSAQNNISARTSEDQDSIVVENHDEWQGVQKISINYIDSGESYNIKTTNVDIHFTTKIASELRIDPEPKSMAECIKRSDWVKWKETIKAELDSLNEASPHQRWLNVTQIPVLGGW
jgi:hypothetical protein